MTDNEKSSATAMSDNEIIKAQKYCCEADGCDRGCPLVDKCESPIKTMEEFIKFDLDLINRLQAEKEALIAGQKTLQKALAESEANFKEAAKRFYKHGVKDFQEKLKDKMNNVAKVEIGERSYYLIGLDFVNTVAKELTGDAE